MIDSLPTVPEREKPLSVAEQEAGSPCASTPVIWTKPVPSPLSGPEPLVVSNSTVPDAFPLPSNEGIPGSGDPSISIAICQSAAASTRRCSRDSIRSCRWQRCGDRRRSDDGRVRERLLTRKFLATS
ncbi:hypothetical protein RRSWK_04698 [Rhodopirellula sp. SWK7]|nr:hypothetical protein RRSWK_04698 [Rhodopirellula sp. SWK7]